MNTSITKGQLALTGGGLLLFVLLLFADTKPRPEKKEQENKPLATVDLSQLQNRELTALPAASRSKIEKLEKQVSVSNGSVKAALLDSIVKEWDLQRKPLMAAYYTELMAEAQPGAESWKLSGDRYFAAAGFLKPEERQPAFAMAIKSYEKALKLKPDDTDTKINLAACYVEGSADPMKGITMLREIEKTDSNNVSLQLNLAVFSERSGQWDKVLARYNKVLQLDSTYVVAYLHIAQAWENKGDTAKTIANLEKYVRLERDMTARSAVQEYIDKLKRN